jgi:t-SNARE complex subunit (syntaxin)
LIVLLSSKRRKAEYDRNVRRKNMNYGYGIGGLVILIIVVVVLLKILGVI